MIENKLIENYVCNKKYDKIALKQYQDDLK